MNNAPSSERIAAPERAARTYWRRLAHAGSLSRLRTHAVAASVAAASARWRLLADVLKGARTSRVARLPLEEALLQVYLFAGYPRAIEALATLAELWPRKARGRAIPPSEWETRGQRLCLQVYGKNYQKLRRNIAQAHPDLDRWMVREGYGKVLSRPGLDSVSRELCSVGVLVAQVAPRQLEAHVRGALNVGASAAQVKAAVTLGALGCNVQTWRRLDRLVTEWLQTPQSGERP